jgi:hypothetical protein
MNGYSLEDAKALKKFVFSIEKGLGSLYIGSERECGFGERATRVDGESRNCYMRESTMPKPIQSLFNYFMTKIYVFIFSDLQVRL